jgi:hypothetical protein
MAEYHLHLDPTAGWTSDILAPILSAVETLSAALGGPQKFQSQIGPVTICRRQIAFGGLARKGQVTLSAAYFDEWTVVHELAHAWDAAHAWRLSRALRIAMGAGFPSLWAKLRHDLRRLRWLPPAPPSQWYRPGQYPPPCGIDPNFNEREDFAETVTAWVYPERAKLTAAARGWPYHDPSTGRAYATFADTPRGLWLADLLKGS